MTVWLAGVGPAGETSARIELGHGCSPEEALWGVGLVARAWLDAARDPEHHSDPDHPSTPAGSVGPGGPRDRAVVVRVAVRPAGLADRPPPPRAPQRDPGLAPAPPQVPVPVQRVAAYGLVRSARGVLLTRFSVRTAWAGQWGLPGGGLDPGEEPAAAVAREVHEETGQRVRVGALLQVRSDHWIGRAPDGRIEDFHTVRLIFAGSCPDPGEPVVHDHGGTTDAAAWVSGARLAGLTLPPWCAAVLRPVPDPRPPQPRRRRRSSPS